MSISCNVREHDLINLRKLAEEQINQRAEKDKNGILQQTHDIKLAESFSHITKKIDEVKETTRNLGEVIKKSQPETPQLAIAKTPTTHQPIENNEGSIYDVELENTLNIMKKNTGFFETKHDPKHGWMLNNQSINILRDTEMETNSNKYNKTPGPQKVFTETSNIPLKKLNDKQRETYVNTLGDFNFENYKAVSEENKSGRYNISKIIFRNDLKGQGIQQITIPSTIIDIYTRLEILLGPKLSGHADTLTEARSLIDELYKSGEIQTEQQYRNALDKFSKV